MMFLFNYVNSQVPAVNFPGCSGCLQHPRSEGREGSDFPRFIGLNWEKMLHHLERKGDSIEKDGLE